MAASLRAVPFWSADEVAAALSTVIAHLRAGRILAYPTETVYGFGGAPEVDAVDRVVRLKNRPPGKPFLLLISGSDMLDRLDLHLPSAASRLAARHWPGPLTLVLPGGARRVPPRLRGPEGGVAVRWTPHGGLNRLISAFGDPITSTSANRPRQPPANSAGEVLRDWEMEVATGSVMVLDGGTLPPSEASTVVDCTGRHPRVIRPGAIPAAVLRETAPDLVGDM
ncbi:MAG: L-threonylcarbamoyladenylate synthase [Gemmatimonadaceae bacterium]